MKSMAKFGGILGLICLIATAMLASMNAATAERIRMQAERELQDSLKEVMPDSAAFEPVTVGNEISYYRVTDAGGKLLGAAFKASAKGYSSIIDTVVGMTTDGTISAIKVVSQQETPGLGSRISEVAGTVSILDFIRGVRPQKGLKPWFQAGFNQKNIADLDKVEAITGATISSRAVINSVKQKALQILTILNNG
jgi:Na+-translocating ferredoxin:NAD+ oxidoreductase subunit G